MHVPLFATLSFLGALVLASVPGSAANADGGADVAIPASALIQPADLAARLSSAGSQPVILQVGFSVLYAEAHIPKAQYAGPTSKEEGIQNLNKHVGRLPRDQLIVIYCGCCPWIRCPNIAAGYLQLRALGFTNVKALYLAHNFGEDWVDKGYPVERGE